jgi:polar amino acid transport system substrate-binding protein
VEVFGAGRVFVLDDFRRATLYKDGREDQLTLKTQDKGQQAQVKQVCASVLEGGGAPIRLDDLAATSRATFRVLDSLRERQPFEI